MNQLRLYMQIFRTFKEMNSDFKLIVFENCKHRIVIYDEKILNKNTIENKIRFLQNTIENKFRFLLSSEVIFFNDRIVTHL